MKTYDRRGRFKAAHRNGTPVVTFNYNDADLLTGENHVGGTLSGLSVSIGYNNHLKRSSLSLAGATGAHDGEGNGVASKLGKAMGSHLNS